MRVFILPSPHRLAVHATYSNLRSLCPDWIIVVADEQNLQWIQKHLLEEKESYFMMIYAGDRITPALAEDLPTLLGNLPEDSSGYIVDTTVGEPYPFLWKTYKWLQSFTIPPHSFASYTYLSTFFQSSPDSWLSLPKRYIKQSKRNFSPLEKEKWSLLRPILASHPIPYQEYEPKVTVVICTYNQGVYLHEAIRSVLCQTFRNWELIIVNDRSTDDTAEILDSYSNRRIRAITLSNNQGKASALNLALSLAKTDWLIELDADDWLHPHCLERLWNKGCIHATSLITADHAEWIETRNNPLQFRAIRCGGSRDIIHLLNHGYPTAPRMYATSVLRERGGWLVDDPFGGRMYEDIQILIRLLKDSSHMHCPEVLYHRRIHGKSITHQHTDYLVWKTWAENHLL